MKESKKFLNSYAWFVIFSIFLSSVFGLPISIAQAQEQKITIIAHTGAVGGLYMEPITVWAEMWRKELPGVDVSQYLEEG